MYKLPTGKKINIYTRMYITLSIGKVPRRLVSFVDYLYGVSILAEQKFETSLLWCLQLVVSFL